MALKHGQRWAECLRASDRTIALDPEHGPGAQWNAGIAATALGEWSRARAAWTASGVKVPAGDGPLLMQLGVAAARLSPEDAPEVVFGQRLDPCRMRLISVPLPESKHRFGDIVLHDGEARGRRRIDGEEVPVFDELLLLEPSSYGTWTVEATCPGRHERDALLELFEDVDGSIEDWTETVQIICGRCSRGEPHEHHPQEREGWRLDRTLGLALRDERDLKKLRHLGLWRRRGIGTVTRVL